MAFVSTNFRREIDFRYFVGLGLTAQILKSKNQALDCEAVIIGVDNSIQMLMLEKSADNFDKILKLMSHKE